MNRRALLIAFVVSLLGVALLVIYLRRFEEEASGGEPVKVLTALKPIQGGKVITDDLLATRVVPRAYLEDRAILETERAKIVGLKVGHTVQAQQVLMWTDLAIAMDERRNLSSLVQTGMRAVTVKAGTEGNSAALIRPGDRIDVIATMPQTGPGAAADARNSVVLLQNVLVLAVGGDTGSDPLEKASSSSRDMVFSLSLNIPEAQLLALATEKGRITVALRNPDDVRVTEGMSDMNSSALSDTKARGQLQGIRRAGPVKVE
jgi:pilus assembly protein CpaB